ncbi:MAG: phenylacetic acid degradation protein PaaN, partial [Xanthomonadaceae bacterium]|nr:phenylacetic acid degradation protein PaaN [Xanthomonadaceae bacterium]
VARIESANSGKWGEVILRSEALTHPEFEGARVHSPVMLKVTDENQYYAEEQFGPISFVISTHTIETGIELSKSLTREKGALTVGLYSTKEPIIEAVIEATLESQVALSINLTEGVFVNQSSAYSDYHGTGGNPAANASYADSAFVANRFRVIQRRYHTQEAV